MAATRRRHNYNWTMTSRRLPEKTTDVKIIPRSKPLAMNVYRGDDKRHFEVHDPLKFTDFGITELDELGPIIEKKQNAVVKELMKMLSKRYERLRDTPAQLGIQPALTAPQGSQPQSSQGKRKRVEFHPEIKVPGLECNREPPEGVKFVNCLVIEKPERGLFFIDEYGNPAFQRWSDIDKAGVATMLSYIPVASQIQTPANIKFCADLNAKIRDHPDRETLITKKVKLEALGIHLD